MRIRQPLIYKTEDGIEHRDLIGVNAPLEFLRKGEVGIFRGLATEMDASISNRQLSISLGNDVITRQVLPLKYGIRPVVKFDLKK